MERKNAWEKYPEGKKREEVFQFAEDYRKFISECKTERECTTEFAKRAEKAGFVNLDEVLEKGTKLKAGDRVYANNMGKGIAMFVIGKKGLEAGMNILGAHIDSPRMDLKQDPLYEDTDFAMLDTHYYGGIKKYQWVTLPLALHGVIAKKDGTVVKVNVGDKPGDPVFGVSDLLIHLSGEQLEKKAAKVIEGENLDLIIGNSYTIAYRTFLIFEELLIILNGRQPPLIIQALLHSTDNSFISKALYMASVFIIINKRRRIQQQFHFTFCEQFNRFVHIKPSDFLNNIPVSSSHLPGFMPNCSLIKALI